MRSFSTRLALAFSAMLIGTMALTDMLLHDWPSIDWVAEHNPVIITNRVLSNNIFEQKRRTRLITPLP